MIFNAPASSHRGGVWERMIGAARRIIECNLYEHRSRVDDEGLLTVMSEAASVINSRPLNVDNISDPQSLEPLTPNHLITMKSKIIPHLLAAENAECCDLYASKQWRRVQYMINLFWSRWKREIVQQYLFRAKWNRRRVNLTRVRERGGTRDVISLSLPCPLSSRGRVGQPLTSAFRRSPVIGQLLSGEVVG
ncbi:hypothetical protein O3P69_006443 [Scylla paramamosain]|uniref:DUF5641 domain-containing protein n=1 Tax=Scylla paramamosain TaxID=85552 RepID=A0AAW0U623_SCYPA